MTDEREEQVKKDLLWEYTKAVSALEAFRVQFREAANTYLALGKLFRDTPEDFDPDLTLMSSDLQKLAVMATEYKELLLKNEERRNSLIQMRVISI
jgi:hypothetical protein